MTIPTPKPLMPQVLVYLEDAPDTPLGGGPIQTDNRDAVRWDRGRAQKGWPAGTDAPLLWLTFLAWAAAQRLGLFSGPYDAFEAQAVHVMAATGPDAITTPVELDPTQ